MNYDRGHQHMQIYTRVRSHRMNRHLNSDRGTILLSKITLKFLNDLHCDDDPYSCLHVHRFSDLINRR